MNNYNPKPIDLNHIELDSDLISLREAIAENAHDVWGAERQKQGWTYGPKRDDDKKQNPCMVPYSELPESEKTFDREMATSALKLVKALGYDLVKREETALYHALLTRIRDAEIEFLCPHCLAKGVKTPVSRHDVFCNQCGHKLEIDWNAYKK